LGGRPRAAEAAVEGKRLGEAAEEAARQMRGRRANRRRALWSTRRRTP
jgi:hypothetical protein